MRRNDRNDNRRRDAPKAPWTPKTDLGRRVAAGQVTSLDQIYSTGQKILEPEIIDALLPDLQEVVMDVSSTQRMTSYGRKMQMRAVVIIGNKRGYIGLGQGKGAEVIDAISEGIRDAKKHIMKVEFGYGSWEGGDANTMSVPRAVTGKAASTQLTLKPSPPGVGIVAGETAKRVLELAGYKNVWTTSKGRTRNIKNMIAATINALEQLTTLRNGKFKK